MLDLKPRVHWDRLAWNRLLTPKHRFICWLAAQCRLQTTAKLAGIGISQSALCLICGLQDEDHNHLFFQCQFSYQIMQAMQQWLGVPMAGTLHQLVRKIGHSRVTKFRKQVIFAAIGTAVYLIWKSRNASFWDNHIPTVSHTVGSLKQLVKGRIQIVLPKAVSKRDYDWFITL
ncbi:uncharacterized protein [Spinacia oleracea]|uniref:Reverse transcriptase zinc-binding domain-containing protein n=1 Tax=Spinacia oleracea TaxID=3562 RepID=A0ABM3QXF5_SPIOL|nr:uncharacterized protein LOC130463048 [Spinacia oleracea]